MPAAGQITVCTDRQNRVITQVGASVSQFPNLSQRDSVPLLVKIADPPTNPQGGSATVLTSTAISTGSLRLVVASKANSNQNDTTYWLANVLEAGWTWDSGQQGFTGVLNLNTTAMQAFMAAQSGELATVEIEIRFVPATGNPSTLLPGPNNKITIFENDDTGAAMAMIGGIPTWLLPLQFKDPASGEVYVLARTAPGVLSFDQI